MPARPSDFLRKVFQHSEGDVWVGSLLNDSSNGGGEKSLPSRVPDDIDAFVTRWDQAGRGCYFCVGTVKDGTSRKTKGSLREIVLLHSDIDTKDLTISRDEAVARVGALPIPPSIIVDSGRGTHVYWLLREPMDATFENIERVEKALRQLRTILCGDPLPCQAAAYMRLPGSHNTKGDEWRPVSVIGGTWVAHELDDLEDWLEGQPVIIEGRARTISQRARNPFLDALVEHGLKPRINVDDRLAAMEFQGPGDCSIHKTQLSVSAAMLNRGIHPDDVVTTLLEATRVAAGREGEQWNWTKEEQAIRRMCADWLAKPRGKR